MQFGFFCFFTDLFIHFSKSPDPNRHTACLFEHVDVDVVRARARRHVQPVPVGDGVRSQLAQRAKVDCNRQAPRVHAAHRARAGADRVRSSAFFGMCVCQRAAATARASERTTPRTATCCLEFRGHARTFLHGSQYPVIDSGQHFPARPATLPLYNHVPPS